MDGALALSFALHGFAGSDPCTLVAADRMGLETANMLGVVTARIGVYESWGLCWVISKSQTHALHITST